MVLRAFAGPFLATFVLSMFLFLMQFLWKYIDDLVGKGVSPLILAELIFYSLADLVIMALPLTIMVAGLMTFGNLSENSSLVAMKSSGISLMRILRPLIIFMAFLCVGNYFFMNYLIPKAHFEGIALLWDLRQKKPAFNIDEGVFYNEIQNFTIRLGKKDDDNETVHDIVIYQFKNDNSKLLTIMRAKDGVMKLSKDKRTLIFNLENGSRYDEMTSSENYDKDKPFNLMHFKQQLMTIDLSSLDLKFTERAAYNGDQAMMNSQQLQKSLDTLNMEMDKRIADTRFFWGRFIHFPHYFTNGYRDNKYDAVKDSVIVPITAKSQDIIDEFPSNLHTQIVSVALNNARGLKGSTDGSLSSLLTAKQEAAPFKVEWHKKFTLSSISMLLFLIAAPLGAIIRKGGIGMPLVVSVVMFVLFYAVNLVGEKIGVSGAVPVWMGMWLSSLVLLPIGLWITYKASQDAAAIPIDKIGTLFKNLIIKPIQNLIHRKSKSAL